jgi:hypothetical protein
MSTHTPRSNGQSTGRYHGRFLSTTFVTAAQPVHGPVQDGKDVGEGDLPSREATQQSVDHAGDDRVGVGDEFVVDSGEYFQAGRADELQPEAKQLLPVGEDRTRKQAASISGWRSQGSKIACNSLIRPW